MKKGDYESMDINTSQTAQTQQQQQLEQRKGNQSSLKAA